LKNFKVLTLFLILALAISPTMFVDGKAFSIDLEKQQTIFENKQIIEQNDLTQKLKHSFIILHESISIQTNDENKNSELQSVQHDDIIVSSLTNEHQTQTTKKSSNLNQMRNKRHLQKKTFLQQILGLMSTTKAVPNT